MSELRWREVTEDWPKEEDCRKNFHARRRDRDGHVFKIIAYGNQVRGLKFTEAAGPIPEPLPPEPELELPEGWGKIDDKHRLVAGKWVWEICVGRVKKTPAEYASLVLCGASRAEAVRRVNAAVKAIEETK